MKMMELNTSYGPVFLNPNSVQAIKPDTNGPESMNRGTAILLNGEDSYYTVPEPTNVIVSMWEKCIKGTN